MSLHIRISRAYVTKIAEKFAEECEKLLIYEHEADEEVNRTHMHMYMVNPTVSTDTLKNYVRKVYYQEAPWPRNDWMFATTYSKQKIPVNDGLITYMAKGNLEFKYNKGFDEGFINEMRAKWVSPAQWCVANGKLEVKGVDIADVKRPTVYEMQMEVAHRIDRNQLTTDDEILDCIGDVMRKHRHRTHMYDTMNWYDNVRFLSESQRSSFRDDVLGKIRSRR